MGLSGLEPPTSRLSGVRSNRLSYKPRLILFMSGDGEIRTLDPLLARQVLSQLSYAPNFFEIVSLRGIAEICKGNYLYFVQKQISNALASDSKSYL